MIQLSTLGKTDLVIPWADLEEGITYMGVFKVNKIKNNFFSFTLSCKLIVSGSPKYDILSYIYSEKDMIRRCQVYQENTLQKDRVVYASITT